MILGEAPLPTRAEGRGGWRLLEVVDRHAEEMQQVRAVHVVLPLLEPDVTIAAYSPSIEHMNDPVSSRLEQLRFLERVQLADLERTQRWIEAEETREAERQRGEQARPPAPDWMIEQGLNGGMPVYVHRGDCHMKGKRSRGVTEDQARRALAEGVAACTYCRPDTDLGVLDG